MSCNGCAKKYGILFYREVGCPKCGYSYCGKCLNYSITSQKKKVCLGCFNKTLDETSKKKECISPPESFIKRMEKFDASSPKSETPLNNLGGSVNPSRDIDSDIKKRLDALRRDKIMKSVPSESEMKMRLAQLKGQEYKEYRNDHVFAVDPRSDQQKMDDLLKQYNEEVAINESADPLKDLEKRLANLRGDKTSHGKTSKTRSVELTYNDNEDEDEEIAAKKIAKKYLEEAELGDITLEPEEKEFIESLPKPRTESEELPWCTVCNEDAVIRCIGCDGELFCKECFKEIHDDEEYRAHKTKAYSKK